MAIQNQEKSYKLHGFIGMQSYDRLQCVYVWTSNE